MMSCPTKKTRVHVLSQVALQGDSGKKSLKLKNNLDKVKSSKNPFPKYIFGQSCISMRILYWFSLSRD